MMPIMNSSISSSDLNPEAKPWRRFTATLLVAAAAVLAGLIALAYAVDPYDTGRSELFAKPRARPRLQRHDRGKFPHPDHLSRTAEEDDRPRLRPAVGSGVGAEGASHPDRVVPAASQGAAQGHRRQRRRPVVHVRSGFAERQA